MGGTGTAAAGWLVAGSILGVTGSVLLTVAERGLAGCAEVGWASLLVG
jgi:hypothetical protein